MRLFHRAAQPPGLFFHLSYVALAFYSLGLEMFADGHDEAVILTLPFGIYYVLRLLFSLLLRVVKGATFAEWNWYLWLVFPLLATLNIQAATYQVPLKLAFALSRIPMERLALQMLSDPQPKVHRNRRIGVFTAIEVERQNNHVRFWLSEGRRGSEFITCGFWYSTQAQPTSNPKGMNLKQALEGYNRTTRITPWRNDWFRGEEADDNSGH